MADFDDGYFTNRLQPLYSCLSEPIFYLRLRYTQKAVQGYGQAVELSKNGYKMVYGE
ncbi:MAG: hypothetical protein N2646_04825 [Bellilinea sp.]|nr:hypothetical protein [Bellilinea sp.]